MRVVLLILMMWAGMAARAQTYTSSTQGNFLVYSIQSLTVTSNSGLIAINTPNDYFNGVVANSYASLSVKSNANWLVSFAAQSAYFTALSKGSSTDMPAGVIGIRVSGQSSFKTLSTQSQSLATGARGSNTSKHDFGVDVNFNPGFKYSGGLYSIGVMYTLTRQ